MEDKKVHKHRDTDDIVLEEGGGDDDVELSDEEGYTGDKVKKLRLELRTCEQEKQEYLDGWQRARADFLNYKRRTEEDASRREEQNIGKYIENLIPLLDSFALATAGNSWENADKNFKQGFLMIQSQLDALLKDLRVEIIAPTDEPFDPVLHEAISETEVTKEREGSVVTLIQPGYRRGTTIIRAARVVVGTHTPS
jgi:molecular chaperone GrpE